MTKYIEVKLTEDQAYDIISLMESWLPSSEWWLEEYQAKEQRGDLQKYHPHGNWTPEEYENTKRKVAFRKRLLTKLAQALVTEQAKS